MPNSNDRPKHEPGPKRVTYHIYSDENGSEILSPTAITGTKRDEIYQDTGIYQNIQQVTRNTEALSQNKEFTFDKEFVRYCQSYVKETSQPYTYQIMADSQYTHEDDCSTSCGRCVSSLPAASLISWLTLVVGVSSCCGSLLVAIRRTRDLLEKPDSFFDFSDIVCIAVLCGMIFLGILVVIAATLVSSPNNKAMFNTTTKNTCASALNITVIVLLVLLFIAWLCVTIILSIPVMACTLLHVLYRETGIESIDLRNYGIYDESFVLSGRKLDTFYQEGLDAFTCYLIALSGSILTVISLVMFLMSATANHVHIREARYSVFNAYTKDLIGSRISVVDTKM